MIVVAKVLYGGRRFNGSRAYTPLFGAFSQQCLCDFKEPRQFGFNAIQLVHGLIQRGAVIHVQDLTRDGFGGVAGEE